MRKLGNYAIIPAVMTVTTHATLGAVLGLAAGNPALAFVFGFVSHFLIDMIPHGDTGLSDNFRVHKVKQKHAVAYVLIDGIVALFFVLLLANTRDIDSMSLYTWGIVGGVLPDFIVGIYEVTKTPLLKWFDKLHFYFHDYFVRKKGDVPLKYAIIAQIVFIAILQSKI